MNLGGPVWHASVAARSLAIPAVLKREALTQLTGVGDASLGEWEEWTGRAFHVRRRLSPAEAKHVGPVADIRRTDEARMRASRVPGLRSLAPPEILAEELGI